MIDWIRNRLRGRDYARDSLILTVGTAAAQTLTIAATPLLSRIYSPAEFGVLALFMALSGILATAVTLRFEAAILLPKTTSDATALVKLSLLCIAALGAVVTAVLVLVPAQAQADLGLAALGPWIIVAGVTGIGLAAVATATAWLNRHRLYMKLAKLRVFQGVGFVAVALTLGYAGIAQGLVIGHALSVLLAALLVLPLFVEVVKSKPDHSDPSDDQQSSISRLKAVASTYRSHPKYLLPAALLDVITLQLPVLLITAWYSTASAGQFSMAWRVLALPIILIGAAVGQVFIQRFASAWPDQLAAKRLLVKTWFALGLLGMMPMALIGVGGEPIFSFIFGSQWAESGQIAQWLAPLLFLMLISSPTSGTYLVLGLQHYSLLFGIASLIYRPAALAVGLLTGDLMDGVKTLVVCEMIQIGCYQYIAWRKVSYRANLAQTHL